MDKRASKTLDKEIEAAYYRLADGRQIDIMDISKLFRDVRQEVCQGYGISESVQRAIDRYCLPAGSDEAMTLTVERA